MNNYFYNVVNAKFLFHQGNGKKVKPKNPDVPGSLSLLRDYHNFIGGVQKYRFVGAAEAHFEFHNPNILKDHADLAINNNRYSYADIRHIFGIVDILMTFTCFKFWFFLLA